MVSTERHGTATTAYEGSGVVDSPTLSYDAGNRPAQMGSTAFGWDTINGRRSSMKRRAEASVTFAYSDAVRLTVFSDPNAGVSSTCAYDTSGQLTLLSLSPVSSDDATSTITYVHDESFRPPRGLTLVQMLHDTATTVSPPLPVLDQARVASCRQLLGSSCVLSQSGGVVRSSDARPTSISSSVPSDCSREPLGRLALLAGQHPAVDLQGEGDRRVPEPLRDHMWSHAGLQKDRRVRVPRVVEAQPLEALSGGDGPELR